VRRNKPPGAMSQSDNSSISGEKKRDIKEQLKALGGAGLEIDSN